MKTLSSLLKEIYSLSKPFSLGRGGPSQWLWGVAFLLLTNLCLILSPLVLGGLLDAILGKESPYPMKTKTWLLALTLLIVITMVLRFIWVWLWDRAGYHLGALLRKKTFQKFFQGLQPLSLGTPKKDLLNYFNSDIPSVDTDFTLDGSLFIADGVLQLTLIGAAMFWLSPDMSLFVLAFTPLLPFVIFVLAKKMQALTDKEQDSFSQISSLSDEIISHVPTIKTLGLEGPFMDRFQKLHHKYTSYKLTKIPLHSLFNMYLSLIPYLGGGLLIWLCLLSKPAPFSSPGELFAFYRYILLMTWPLMALALGLQKQQKGLSSWRRLKVFFEDTSKTSPQGRKSLPHLESLKVKNLSFSLKGQTFGPFQCELLKGQSMALSGPMGSGKSLLLQHLVGFLKPPPKSVFFNDIPLEEIQEEQLLQHTSYIGEDSFLFKESLRYNLAFHKPLSQQQLWDVLEAVDLKDELKEKNMNLESLLDPKGHNFSGGQRQRLLLGRALLKKPKLLILDNALNSLDYKTYHKVTQTLMEFQKKHNMALIVSSHQKDLVEKMDRQWILPARPLQRNQKDQQ